MAGRKIPRVGIGVMVLKGNEHGSRASRTKVLLTKRKGAHGSGEWGWYDKDHLPRPLFGAIEQTLEALKTGKNFFDS